MERKKHNKKATHIEIKCENKKDKMNFYKIYQKEKDDEEIFAEKFLAKITDNENSNNLLKIKLKNLTKSINLITTDSIISNELIQSHNILYLTLQQKQKNNPFKYEIPKFFNYIHTNLYKYNLKDEEDILSEIEEKNDIVFPINFYNNNDFNILIKVKQLLKNENLDKTINYNIYIENLYKIFIKKKENFINFIFDSIYLPNINNFLYFKNLITKKKFFDEDFDISNFVKNKIQNELTSNNLNRINKFSLNNLLKEKIIKYIISDNPDLNEKRNEEKFDFTNFAFLNNKVTKDYPVNFASNNIKKFIFSKSFKIKIKKSETNIISQIYGFKKSKTNIKKITFPNLLKFHLDYHKTFNYYLNEKNNDQIIENIIKKMKKQNKF